MNQLLGNSLCKEIMIACSEEDEIIIILILTEAIPLNVICLSLPLWTKVKLLHNTGRFWLVYIAVFDKQ